MSKVSPAYARLLNAALKSDRLLLEPLTADHALELFELLQQEEIYRWISALPPKSVDELRQLYSLRESRMSPSEDEIWPNWVVRRSSDGQCVGKLDACIDFKNTATNIGYLFFPSYWGQGYATEAVSLMTHHLAGHGISKMVATVTLGNTNSYRVLEKSGFVRSRTIAGNDTIRGEKYDDVEFIWTSPLHPRSD